MASKTKIKYADKVANPYSGCQLCSAGCLNCYALKAAEHPRLRGKYGYPLDDPFRPGVYHPGWERGLGGKPSIVFVGSMTDMFGQWMTFSQIDNVITRCASKNINLFLTKRPKRMGEYLNHDILGEILFLNFYFGVSICNQADWDKNRKALKIIKGFGFKTWISFEPLLEKISLGATPLPADRIIIGGESGHKARPMRSEWALCLKDRAEKENIPVWFKQPGDWAEKNLDWNDYSKYPKITEIKPMEFWR